jgi:hypothetical protein
LGRKARKAKVKSIGHQLDHGWLRRVLPNKSIKPKGIQPKNKFQFRYQKSQESLAIAPMTNKAVLTKLDITRAKPNLALVDMKLFIINYYYTWRTPIMVTLSSLPWKF